MATIHRYPFVKHLRGTTTIHVHHLSGGRLRHSGAGTAFWFRPLSAVISKVPIDDREQTVLIPVRSVDLHQVSVPGTVTYRFGDPDLAARRLEFAIDVTSGGWTQTPLEAVGAMIHGATGSAVTSATSHLGLGAILRIDPTVLGHDVQTALASDDRLSAVGLEVVGVRFGLIRPDPDVERALQTPAREAIQQAADRATFERRADAVAREAAIGENELANEIELSRRREQLIEQDGSNDRRTAHETAAAEGIATAAQAERTLATARAQAEADRVIGAAAADTEQAMLTSYQDVSSDLLLALAAREAAGQLPQIEQLVLTPDLLQGLLGRLGTRPTGA